MIALTQITNTEIFTFIAVLVFKFLSRKVFLINRKKQISRVNYSKVITSWNAKCWSAFSSCMTVPLTYAYMKQTVTSGLCYIENLIFFENSIV